MKEAIQLMLPAAVACFILVGIHGYLGTHILARGVIFVDLALAQMAAVGGAAAILYGLEPHGPAAWLLSLGFTFLGALALVGSRRFATRLPQEALIGSLFVVAGAAVVLILDRTPHGAEEIKELLTGQILLVSWPLLGGTAALYAVIALALAALHSRLWLISRDPAEAERQGLSIARHDLAFYTLFGAVVTSSVRLAGVLPVFAFLIIPASGTRLLGISGRWQLPWVWAGGGMASLAGLAASYWLDLPTSPAVVASFGLMLLATLFVVAFRRPVLSGH